MTLEELIELVQNQQIEIKELKSHIDAVDLRLKRSDDYLQEIVDTLTESVDALIKLRQLEE